MSTMIADIDGVKSFLDDLMVYRGTEDDRFILREEKCKLVQLQIK